MKAFKEMLEATDNAVHDEEEFLETENYAELKNDSVEDGDKENQGGRSCE